MPGEAVAAGLHGHLIPAVVRVAGELAALAGLEIQLVGAVAGAFAGHQILGLRHRLRAEAEGPVALLASRDGLEDHVAGRALLHCLDLSGDVPEHADLRGDLKFALDLVKALQDLRQALGAVSFTGLRPMTASPTP